MTVSVTEETHVDVRGFTRVYAHTHAYGRGRRLFIFGDTSEAYAGAHVSLAGTEIYGPFIMATTGTLGKEEQERARHRGS